MFSKILIVATVAVTAIAQPFYTAGATMVNIIACSSDTVCAAQAPMPGANFYCYGATYRQNLGPTKAGGSLINSNIGICMPSGFVDSYTTELLGLAIQVDNYGAFYDNWYFTRKTASGSITVAADNMPEVQARCMTNADCSAMTVAANGASWCCADVMVT
jgi:hypothetical protein